MEFGALMILNLTSFILNGVYIRNAEECFKLLKEKNLMYGKNNDSSWCKGTHDDILCWPASPPNSLTSQNCPKFKRLLHDKFANKMCTKNGTWYVRPNKADNITKGFTDYWNCYSKDMQDMILRIGLQDMNVDVQKKMKLWAIRARILEISGLTISIVSLIIALFILYYFDVLKCHRTRIHRNLFVAILIHDTIQLIRHSDTHLVATSSVVLDTKGNAGGNNTSLSIVEDGGIGTIYNTAILCEILESLVVYTQTVMIMWMFIEGWFLHNLIAVSVFDTEPNYKIMHIVGWAVPLLITIVWVLTNCFLNKEVCWQYYQHRLDFWIVQAPRLLLISTNLIFLLNIIRVLVSKLKDNNSTETLRVKKAVKAAIVLLPLLGVNNFLAVPSAPITSVESFASFSIIVRLLISFQGFVITVLYCFLNGEVQQVIKRKLTKYNTYHQTSVCRPAQALSANSIANNNMVHSQSVGQQLQMQITNNNSLSPRQPLLLRKRSESII